MGAPSKRARRIRTAAEFDTARLSAALRPTRNSRATINAWALEDIFAAREAQMRGDFYRAARMAEQMRTDDALAVAYENRLAPQRCIDTELVPAKGARGASVAAEANALFGPTGVAIHPDTRADIHGCLINHGVAFAVCTPVPREDGSRVDYAVNYWPIEFVRWDPVGQQFLARVDTTEGIPAPLPGDPAGVGLAMSGNEVPIVHGNGRWIVFKKHEIDPFRQEAAILAGCLVWARHAFAARDWAKGSVSHGSAKVVGELPEGTTLQDANGDLTPQAAAFIALLQALGSEDTPVGVRPFGSKTDFMTNSSTAWQVWKELIANAETAAARIYLGTDGTLGSNGGAPGVDITALFGVALTKVRGDLECISRGINTGVIEPWCAMNFGDSTLAPAHRYKVPDEDSEQLADETSKKNQAFFADVAAARENGFDVTQAWVDELAKKYGIEVPLLKVAAPVVAPGAAPAAPSV